MRFVTAGFNPLTLSPALWLDAADASTLFDATTGGSLVAPDGSIARWEDKSGNARHATQGTVLSRPQRKTAIQNGRDVVRFDGSDSLLTSSRSTPAACTIFLVTQASAWNPTVYRSPYSHAYNTANQSAFGIHITLAPAAALDWAANDYLCLGSGFTSGRGPRAIGAAASGSNYRLLSLSLSSAEARLWANGSRVSTRVEVTGAIQSISGPVVIGGTINTNEFWIGDIGEVLTFDYSATTDQRQTVERYLASKWGITI